mmetsp:Transcript_35889/g.99198  ORF Transcript_35889/g.99198 Transcript_35889/m.99198 type:complete len:160 (-) Transcript_35889:339-818(-)
MLLLLAAHSLAAAMEDKDIAVFILKWGSDVRTLIFMLLLLAALVALNIWLYRKRKQRENDDAIEWTQNMGEVEMDFPLPAGKTSRDVECKIMPTTIRFGIKGESKPMLEGTLSRKVVPDECNWQLWPVGAPKTAKLTLVKAKEGNWKSILADGDDPKTK